MNRDNSGRFISRSKTKIEPEPEGNPKMPSALIKFLVAVFAAILIFFIVIFPCFYTVSEGTVGVILRNGALTGTATPGLGMKMPWVDDVIEISVRAEKWEDTMQSYSQDQQVADLKVSVVYQAIPGSIDKVYREYKDLDSLQKKLILPRALQAIKTVFSQYTAPKAINSRGELNLAVDSAVRAAIGENSDISIISVQLEDVSFSDSYEKGVEDSMAAQLKVRQMQQELEQQRITAEKTVVDAQARADSQLAESKANAEAVRVNGQAAADAKLAQAKAEAEGIKLRGDAEASALQAKANALRDNLSLIQLTLAERWDGAQPKMVVPNTASPLLQMPNLAQ